MTVYATYSETILRYPLLATWNTGVGSATTVVNSDLLYFAAQEIDSRLATHFTTPFSAAHPTVKDLCIDLAYYRALRTKDPDQAAKLRDVIDGRIDAIKAGTEYILTGSGTLAPSNPGQTVWSNTEDYHPVHSMLDAEDAMIDPDRLDDEEAERS